MPRYKRWLRTEGMPRCEKNSLSRPDIKGVAVPGGNSKREKEEIEKNKLKQNLNFRWRGYY